MDPIVAQVMAAQGLGNYQDVIGNRMPWGLQPTPLNDRQKIFIQMTIARCEHIYASVMERPQVSEELEEQALEALNNAVFQLEHVESSEQFMEISQIIQMDINFWEAKLLFGNEELQFFHDDLDNNGQPWNLEPVQRRRDGRRG